MLKDVTLNEHCSENLFSLHKIYCEFDGLSRLHFPIPKIPLSFPLDLVYFNLYIFYVYFPPGGLARCQVRPHRAGSEAVCQDCRLQAEVTNLLEAVSSVQLFYKSFRSEVGFPVVSSDRGVIRGQINRARFTG